MSSPSSELRQYILSFPEHPPMLVLLVLALVGLPLTYLITRDAGTRAVTATLIINVVLTSSACIIGLTTGWALSAPIAALTAGSAVLCTLRARIRQRRLPRHARARR